LIPFIAVALLLAITLKQIPLSDTAGMVARGEAVGGEEAERLEAERLSGASASGAPVLLVEDEHEKDDDAELASPRS
ncbi:MAG: MFS transporter, partial [Arthrobacter sp.]|nr:MFS transporter [Arthrobacter sp.]